MAEPGIAVNPASTISAKQWVEIIQRSAHIPDYLKRSIRARGNLIVGWAKITQPSNTIPRDWLVDLAAAFAAGTWEITSAQETFEVARDGKGFGVRRRIYPDLQEGEFGPGHWFSLGPDERIWSPDNYSFDISYRLGDVALLFGETYSSAKVNKQARTGEGSATTRLKSRRALIIIVDRVVAFDAETATPLAARFLPGLFGAFSYRIPIAEHTLVYTFLHELAAHAGRMNQGKTALHSDDTVNAIVREIMEWFPEGVETAHTLQVAAALQTLAGRLTGPAPRVGPTAKGRIPGPLTGPSAGVHPPGPLR